jgi:hypothetical protein
MVLESLLGREILFDHRRSKLDSEVLSDVWYMIRLARKTLKFDPRFGGRPIGFFVLYPNPHTQNLRSPTWTSRRFPLVASADVIFLGSERLFYEFGFPWTWDWVGFGHQKDSTSLVVAM